MLAAELVRIGTETLALIEFCNFAEFVFVETEIPDIKVFEQREGVTDFDHHQPLSRCQRITICAGLPYLSARSRMTFIENAFPPCANGLQDSVWILCVAFQGV